jgi:hypothetical protein
MERSWYNCSLSAVWRLVLWTDPEGTTSASSLSHQPTSCLQFNTWNQAAGQTNWAAAMVVGSVVNSTVRAVIFLGLKNILKIFGVKSCLAGEIAGQVYVCSELQWKKKS